MHKGQSIRESVLDLILHFDVAEMNGTIINEQSQVLFILESLPKIFLQFCSNAIMNKIQYSLTTLLNELQTFESLMKNKGPQQGEANVAHSKKFHKGSSFGTKSVSSSFGPKKFKKETGGKGKTLAVVKGKVKANVADKGRCFQFTEDGT